MFRAFIVLVFLALSGCADWDERWPIPISAEGLSAAEGEALEAAAAEWNEALPTDAFALHAEHHEQFYVRVVRGLEAGPDVAGRTGDFRGRGKHWAEIRFRTDLPAPVLRAMFAHELGHVLLGTAHSPDPTSIMFERYQDGAHVSEADAQAVLEMGPP